MKITATYKLSPALADGTPMQLELPDGEVKNVLCKGSAREKTKAAMQFAVLHFAHTKQITLDKIFYRRSGFYFIDVEAVI
jgi:hypothetical protein